VDFRNTIIMMTSNVGARRLTRQTTVGFQKDTEETQHRLLKDRVIEEARKIFNPEFLNRVDEILVFHRLTHEHLLKIVDIQVQEVVERVREKGFDLELTPEAREFLVRVGSNEEYGARPLRRAIQQHLEDPLAELLLRGGLLPGQKITVGVAEGEEKLAFAPSQPVEEGAAV
jgi:ATP-dependent Clp protease ATP-binding subunit ClpC